MTTISATSILASRHAYHPNMRIDTLLLRYPRWIHAEFMTHRMFSRNASSSRAIPVEKLIQSAIDDPAVPLYWGANQKGMQADQECKAEIFYPTGDGENFYHRTRERAWLEARDTAVEFAKAFAEAGYHKQLVNRLLEPFTHITVVATSTNWSNFLHLRDHSDAEPHIQMLAREIRQALDGATVQNLKVGQWHLPFASDHDSKQQAVASALMVDTTIEEQRKLARTALLKLSVARCASTSYKTVEGFDMTLDRAVALHDKLVGMDPLHASPCEHQAQVDSGYKLTGGNVLWDKPDLGGNLGPGWIQYRKTLIGECR